MVGLAEFLEIIRHYSKHQDLLENKKIDGLRKEHDSYVKKLTKLIEYNT